MPKRDSRAAHYAVLGRAFELCWPDEERRLSLRFPTGITQDGKIRFLGLGYPDPPDPMLALRRWKLERLETLADAVRPHLPPYRRGRPPQPHGSEGDFELVFTVELLMMPKGAKLVMGGASYTKAANLAAWRACVEYAYLKSEGPFAVWKRYRDARKRLSRRLEECAALPVAPTTSLRHALEPLLSEMRVVYCTTFADRYRKALEDAREREMEDVRQ